MNKSQYMISVSFSNDDNQRKRIDYAIKRWRDKKGDNSIIIPKQTTVMCFDGTQKDLTEFLSDLNTRIYIKDNNNEDDISEIVKIYKQDDNKKYISDLKSCTLFFSDDKLSMTNLIKCMDNSVSQLPNTVKDKKDNKIFYSVFSRKGKAEIIPFVNEKTNTLELTVNSYDENTCDFIADKIHNEMQSKIEFTKEIINE
ncbi:MAG: hypothetical protein Q4Q53_05265 [Methanocorpusculum sp.]|nr:hypothetical protein [Methanocorpusculum sp.]